MYWKQTESVPLVTVELCYKSTSKDQSLSPGGGERKYSVYCRASNKNRQLMLQNSGLLDGFLGRVFKGHVWGEGCSSWTFFSPVTGETQGNVSGILVIRLWLQPVWLYVFVLSVWPPSSTWMKVSVSAERVQGMHHMVIYSRRGGTKCAKTNPKDPTPPWKILRQESSGEGSESLLTSTECRLSSDWSVVR